MALSYISLAAALGQSIDIPIILRALTSDYHQNGPDSLPILFDHKFHLYLDAGSDPEDLTAVAPSYHLPWWTSESDVVEMDIMSPYSVDECLLHHHNIMGIKGIIPPRLDKTDTHGHMI